MTDDEATFTEGQDIYRAGMRLISTWCCDVDRFDDVTVEELANVLASRPETNAADDPRYIASRVLIQAMAAFTEQLVDELHAVKLAAVESATGGSISREQVILDVWTDMQGHLELDRLDHHLDRAADEPE
jgi:hypothetical protein